MSILGVLADTDQMKKRTKKIQQIPSAGVEVKSLKYIEVATLVWWGLGGAGAS